MRLLAALLALAALAVVGDRLLAAEAERRAADAASDALGAPAQVELRGFPLAWHLLRGRVPEAVLTARDVPVGDGDGVVSLLRVTLSGVTVALGAAGGERLPPAQAGTFHAEVDAAALAAIVGAPAEYGEVSIGDGEVRFASDGFAAVMAPGVRRGRLTLTLERIEGPAGSADLPAGLRPDIAPLTADLSELPGGPMAQRVRARPGVLVIEGRLARLTAPG